MYADPRFNKEVDLETGFQTHSILAMPVRGGEKNKSVNVALDTTRFRVPPAPIIVVVFTGTILSSAQFAL